MPFKYKSAIALPLFGLLLSATSPARAQMVTGEDMKDFARVFNVVIKQRETPYTTIFLSGTAPGNILWPGEQGGFTFQLQNNLDRPIKTAGRVELIAYGTRGIPGDIWKPEVFKVPGGGSVPINVDMAAKGFQNITVRPSVPARLGGYALVVDLGRHGRQFVTSFVRTFKANPQRLQYPKMSLDYISDDVLRRLGVQAIRYGIPYIPTDDPDYPRWRKEFDDSMKRLRDNNITALLMVGTGHKAQPLGRGRPHLDDDGVMIGGKDDLAWLPAKDADFQKVVADIAGQWGWPKGPVTAFSLWNEPWEGLSISGWGADMIRYREMFTRMAQGVEAARRNDKVDVLLAGADSSSNTFDKFFADGTDTFLPRLDAVTIHYQGMSSPSTYKKWLGRKGPNGRVKVWDTESWVANTDDRVAAVVATNRSAGYDRAMGIFGGNIATESHSRGREVFTANGQKKQQDVAGHTWSAAASVGASQHFIGERNFREILFKNGLPWVMVFDGANGNAEDGTIVVVGDIGEAFGFDSVLFRTVRGLNEVRAKEKIRAQLSTLLAKSPQRAELQAALEKLQPLSGGAMMLDARAGSLFDFYGNAVAARGNTMTVPLDHRGFFLRAAGGKGSFARLIEAVRRARIEGYEPLETIAYDLLAPIEKKPSLRLKLTNILNRPVRGALNVKLGNLQLRGATQTLSFAPHETKMLALQVMGGQAAPENTYPLSLRFNAGRDGVAVHEEAMHVNFVSKRAVKVDGSLDDWNGVIAQPLTSGEDARNVTEAAWFPFRPFDASVKKGIASGYAAYDDRNFYFAAKIADNTPHPGTVRFETRDDDQYFYPEVAYEYDRDKTLLRQEKELETKDDNRKLLQNPDGAGRVGKYWEKTNKNLTFGVDLKLPADRMQQVAVYLGAEELHPNGIELQIVERTTGRELDKQFINNLWGGTWAVFNLAGDVRLRLKTNGDWYSAKLFGLFFGPATGDANANGAAAKFVRWDYDTNGNWKGVYGASGHYIVGATPKLPTGVTVSVPEEIVKQEYKWPQGVRRFSYRKWPTIPGSFVNTYDNVQIAFNAVPVEGEDMLPNPPGTPRFYTDYKSTDYEYDLHSVAPQCGGGTEIWRLLVPGMPRKHFYPRQPKSPFDGAVKSGQLSVRHEGNTRIVEAAIPWSEIPHVRRLMQTGQPLKFGFLVNHDDGGGLMETGRERSVAKRSGLSFHFDWGGHWTNEVEFGWEK